ncbi:MAG: hypothetical protein ABEH86_10645 [Haloarcula sp.]
MGLHTAFAALSEIVDQYESRGQSVRHADATLTDDGSDALDATLELLVSLCPLSSSDSQHGQTPEAASLTDDGDLHVTFSSPIPDLPTPTGATVMTSTERVEVTDSGLVLTLELTIDAAEEAMPSNRTAASETEANATVESDETAGAEHNDRREPTVTASEHSAEADPDSAADGAQPSVQTTDDAGERADCGETTATGSSTLADDLASVRDESVPPYEDTEYLQLLYDECDTFTEMCQWIQMDVSSETVRRYMIEAGIHVPDSYDTAAKADDTSTATDESTPPAPAESGPPQPATATEEPIERTPDEQLVTDGIGLPDHVQISDVAEAVVESVTVYEVQRHLNLDRNRTRDLLEELNLLDLVLRRIADNPEHAVSYDQVASRIRQCAPSGA